MQRKIQIFLLSFLLSMLWTQYALAGVGWIVLCPYSHSLPDDPIVFPNRPGASHLHDFFGNISTNASSTYSSMRGAPTTCGLKDDTGGYWVPALSNNGKRVLASGKRQKFYYRKRVKGVVESFPPDFRMIAGNSKAVSEAGNPQLGKGIYYGCSDNSSPGSLRKPRACSTGIMSLHVEFPNCWDGISLPEGSQGHMVYARGNCPATHPHKFASLIFRFEYPIGKGPQNITLDSGAYYTAHGDFWNTWSQFKLEQLTRDCLSANKNCRQF